MSKPRNPAFFKLASPSLLQALGAFVLYTTVVAIYRWQAILRISTHYLGGSTSDAALYQWLIDTNSHHLFRLPWFNTLSFYPYGESLAWSDNFILPSAVAALLGMLGSPPALAWNLLLLGAFIANGYFVYSLAFRLCGSQLAALLGGLCFCTYTFLSGHLGHPQLQFAFFLPLVLSQTVSFFRRASWWRAALVGILISAAFATTAYFAVFAALLVMLISAAFFVLYPERYLKLSIIGAGAGGLIGLLPLAVLLPPYLDVQSAFGARFLHETYYFSASSLSYVTASPFNFLLGKTSRLSHAEASLYIGMVCSFLSAYALAHAFAHRYFLVPFGAVLGSLVVLIGIGIITPRPIGLPSLPLSGTAALCTWVGSVSMIFLLRRLRKAESRLEYEVVSTRALIAICAFAALIVFFVSLGPCGFPGSAVPALGLHRLFYEVVPGVASVRAVGRLGIIVQLLLSILASLGYTQLAKKKRLRALPFWLLCGFVLVENYHDQYPVESRAARPEIFAQLPHTPGYAAVVLPYSGDVSLGGDVRSWGEFAKLNVAAMQWMVDSELPHVNGYSGQRSKLMHDLPEKLIYFPDPEALKALGEIAALKYVIDLRSAAERPKTKLPSSVRLLSTDAQGNQLLELSAAREMNVDGASLLVPAYAPSTLGFELRTPTHPSTRAWDVDILNEVRGGKAQLISTVQLAADGAWHQFSFRLPAGDNPVLPRKIALRTASTSGRPSILLRDSTVEMVRPTE